MSKNAQFPDIRHLSSAICHPLYETCVFRRCRFIGCVSLATLEVVDDSDDVNCDDDVNDEDDGDDADVVFDEY